MADMKGLYNVFIYFVPVVGVSLLMCAFIMVMVKQPPVILTLQDIPLSQSAPNPPKDTATEPSEEEGIQDMEQNTETLPKHIAPARHSDVEK